MQVSTTALQPIFEGVKQYIVPLFQRTYCWGKKEWSALWDDLFDLYQEEISGLHFMGSIVTIPTQTVPEGVAKFLLIDGQQRMTTFYLILLSIKKIAEQEGDFGFSEEISEVLLVNKFKKDSLDYYKLLPTQKDRTDLIDIVKNIDNNKENLSSITEAYNFFLKKIVRHKVDIKILYSILLKRLTIVSIVLDENDDPHIVFESLNYKGKPLSYADLIRNYFFMKINVKEQDKVYDNVWKPMQDILGDMLPDFVRHYLMKDGDYVNEKDVYAKIKEKINEGNSISYMKSMSDFAIYYDKFINPEHESDRNIRHGLKNIKRLEMTTSFAFLLNVYNDYILKFISAEEFCSVLKTLENFLVRRQICNVPTNQLNKIFPVVYLQMMTKASSKLSYIDKLYSVLQSKNYPNDTIFIRSFHSYKLYGTGREKLGRTILERIEQSYQHKELVDLESLQIEHIMPQALTTEWEVHLGEDFNETHVVFLHTLGNLTLTGYNPELKNYNFVKKKEIYKSSHLEINKYFEKIQNWKEDEILKRTYELAELLANKVYPYFGDDKKAEQHNNDVTFTKPKALYIFSQQFPCKSWQDVLKITLQTIAESDHDKILKLAQEFPSLIGANDSFRVGKPLANGYWYEANLSAKRIFCYCTQIVDFLELNEDDFRVLFE